MVEKERIRQLISKSMEGVIFRNDFIDWACKVQQVYNLSSGITIAAFKKIAEEQGIKIVNNLEQYIRLKERYNSRIEIPIITFEKAKTAPKKPFSREPKPITKEQIEALYIDKGLNQYEVSKALHITTLRLKSLIEYYGIKKECKTAKSKLDKKKIEDLISQGYSCNAISKILGVSCMPIYNYVKRNGIKYNDARKSREVC